MLARVLEALAANAFKTYALSDRTFRENPRDFPRLDLFTDEHSASIPTQKKPSRPVGVGASIGYPHDSVHGVSEVIGHNKVIIRAVMACWGIWGKNLSADELKPPSRFERVGGDIPVSSYNPGTHDRSKGNGNFKEKEKVAFGDAFAVFGIN